MEPANKNGLTSGQLGEEAERVAGSPAFRRSDQLRRMLLYLAERSGAGDMDGLSEKSIGEHVFGRRNFDPRIDTIVRVQARRLRQKLDEHYSEQGERTSSRLILSSHPYLLSLQAEAPPRSVAEPQPRAAVFSRSFGAGLLSGGLLASVLFAVVAMVNRPAAPDLRDNDPAARAVLSHPLWEGFAATGSRPLIAISTPLFVRSLHGYYRDFRLNDPESLGLAESFFGKGVYWPSSDPWLTLSDLEATARLLALLRSGGSRPEVIGGREITGESSRQRDLILIGHPRGIPWLAEGLGDLNFYFVRPEPGKGFTGLMNRKPFAGESPLYRPSGGNDVQKVSETEPDFALVTRRLHASGRRMLSVLGNRARTSSLMVEKLCDPDFLASLGDATAAAFERDEPVQLLFQVRYLSRNRMEAKLLAGRAGARSLAPAQPVAQGAQAR